MALERCVAGMAYELRLVLQRCPNGRTSWSSGGCSATEARGGKLCGRRPGSFSIRCPELHGLSKGTWMESWLSASRADHGLHGGAQHSVINCKPKDRWIADREIHDRYGLPGRREAYPTVLLTH
jgi:hypothetical protein